jgi:hypothetical protein
VWSPTTIGFYSFAGQSATKLSEIPTVFSSPAKIRVAAWPIRHSKIDAIDGVAMSVYVNGKLVLSHVVNRTTDVPGRYIGIATYNTNTVSVSELTIPQLHEIIEWTSVDPDETVSSGMGRVVSQDRIRVQARFNGAVKIWRNDELDVDWVIPPKRILSKQITKNLFWPTHMRMIGAWHERDTYRLGPQGYVFASAQDPNALDAIMTYRRGLRAHRDVEERASTATLKMHPNVLLEPEDIVRLAPDQYKVTSIEYAISWRENSPVMEGSLTCRKQLGDKVIFGQ